MARKNEEEWKRRGLCICCGGEIEPERKGKQKCAACAKRFSDSKKRISKYRESRGECRKCGNKLEQGREGKYLCGPCAKKQGVYQKRSNDKKKAEQNGNTP